MSKDLDDYPKRHPETGKVKNPLTGNFIKPSYAKRKDLLEQAEQHTQQHFREQDDDEDGEEIEQLLREVENAEPGDTFDLSDEELEKLDEHVEVPDSPFPDEDEFAPESEDEFQQPPTPEGFEEAAQQQKGRGEYKGVYTGNPSKGGGRQMRQQSRDSASEMERKHEDDEVRYVKTDAGGMKMVYPEDNQ